MHNFSSNKQSRIKKLSPLLINQLSAGEVVTRPASVVKELLENAIDAGATQIKISITQGGMGLIEISDNGNGIHPDDMLMAVTRHATSKVADVEQLHGISTLGFRGEALASISAVSRLILTSSHDDSGVGRSLSVAGQIDNPDITPVVCSKGTTVSVKDLYFNVPARRSNLKSVQTEYVHIESVVRHVALVYPDIELSLYHDNKSRLQLLVPDDSDNKTKYHHISQKTQLKESYHRLYEEKGLIRFKQAWGHSLPEPAYSLMIDLSVLQSEQVQSIHQYEQSHCSQLKDKKANITGWVWYVDDLEQGCKIELPKLIYVNSRLVKDSSISQQIRQTINALQPSCPISKVVYGYALFLSLPSAWLNLNVHPSKQRISIHTLANINAHIDQALKQLLEPIVTKKKIEQETLGNTCQISSEYKTQVIEDNNSITHITNSPKDTAGFQYPTHQPNKKWQVASRQAVYQLTKTADHHLSDINAYRSLADYLRILTLESNESALNLLFSLSSNQWFNLKQEILGALDYLVKEWFNDCNHLHELSIMWMNLPSSYLDLYLDGSVKCLSTTDTMNTYPRMILVLNHKTGESHSVVYPNHTNLEK